MSRHEGTTGTLAPDLPPQRVCGWCWMELAPGSQPATHGICPGCYVRLEMDMTKRKGQVGAVR